MAKIIRIKRGLDSERQSYVARLGELVWTTDANELWVGDGQTAGGIKVTAKVESNYIPQSEKGQVNGVATLGLDGKIPSEQIPAIAITESFVVNSEDEQLNLSAEEGDVAIRLDIQKNYIHNGGTLGTMDDWTELVVPEQSVTSVNGQTGVVVLNLGDINNVNLIELDTDDLLQWDGTNWVNVRADSVGRTTFISLDDTENTYDGFHDYIVKVDPIEDKLIFSDTIDGGTYSGTTTTLNRQTATLSSPATSSAAETFKFQRPRRNIKIPRRI